MTAEHMLGSIPPPPPFPVLCLGHETDSNLKRERELRVPGTGGQVHRFSFALSSSKSVALPPLNPVVLDSASAGTRQLLPKAVVWKMGGVESACTSLSTQQS